MYWLCSLLISGCDQFLSVLLIWSLLSPQAGSVCRLHHAAPGPDHAAHRDSSVHLWGHRFELERSVTACYSSLTTDQISPVFILTSWQISPAVFPAAAETLLVLVLSDQSASFSYDESRKWVLRAALKFTEDKKLTERYCIMMLKRLTWMLQCGQLYQNCTTFSH